MNRLIYLLFLLFVNAFRLIPMPLLYLKSWFLYLLLFRVIGYRKQVVRQNISRSLPELSLREQRRVIRDSYHYFADQILESIRGFTMSQEQLLERFRIVNPELMDAIYLEGRSIVALGSHYCNWEWASLIAGAQVQHPLYIVYKEIKNPYIDKYIRKHRERFGSVLIDMRETSNYFRREQGNPAAFVLIADQSPSNAKKAIWVDFLNQETACLRGPEVLARNSNFPVIYFHIERVKRGYYTLEVELLAENPAQTEPGEITAKYMQTLEKEIKSRPEFWLWTHKRWKKQR